MGGCGRRTFVGDFIYQIEQLGGACGGEEIPDRDDGEAGLVQHGRVCAPRRRRPLVLCAGHADLEARPEVGRAQVDEVERGEVGPVAEEHLFLVLCRLVRLVGATVQLLQRLVHALVEVRDKRRIRLEDEGVAVVVGAAAELLRVTPREHVAEHARHRTRAVVIGVQVVAAHVVITRLGEPVALGGERARLRRIESIEVWCVDARQPANVPLDFRRLALLELGVEPDDLRVRQVPLELGLQALAAAHLVG